MPARPECPEFYTGAPVDSSDLMFRDVFLAELWEALQTRHVLLTAPRRTGKTSVMDHLRDVPQHGFTVIYQNVQDLTHPADFFKPCSIRCKTNIPSTSSAWRKAGNCSRTR